ncbi:hypothetical protein EIN_525710 [Entamoeba invadens IP1]|uniref:AP180 N-terminal homology (ANTH) domain-containing protein n=1 Tax=Entamoeba invadens IP1 TaxID=370355 RepID=A0A0A1U8X9_ENTIV|nr:hypothetical protein EIN_525710 [Entamoeba invadens IP1]ELP89586.1 hypothetical protein EIN_525710 [Entamoeba invadens IP1]|eukprot:XP_004256357.1 hypothetical protein EIN_525710 [Entamoeba invadens IP1]
MNFFELHYALEYYYMTTELHEEDTLSYFAKCKNESEVKSIAKKVMQMIDKKDILKVFKGLLLYHYLTQIEGRDFSIYFTDLKCTFEKKEKTHLDSNSSQLSFWAQMYSAILNQRLQFYKKYSFLNENFSIKKGKKLPLEFQNIESTEALENDAFSLFGSLNAFVGKFLSKKTKNSYLEKAVEYCITDLIQLLELITNLENYKALLSGNQLQTELPLFCYSQIGIIKSEAEKTKQKIFKATRIPKVTNYQKSVTKLNWFTYKFPIPTLNNTNNTISECFEEDNDVVTSHVVVNAICQALVLD